MLLTKLLKGKPCKLGAPRWFVLRTLFTISCVVHVFGRDTCPYCTSAVKFLKACNVRFQFHDIRDDKEYATATFMLEEEGRSFTTVPQIFVCDKYIGGNSNMIELHLKGEFEPMLKENNIPYKKCPKIVKSPITGDGSKTSVYTRRILAKEAEDAKKAEHFKEIEKIAANNIAAVNSNDRHKPARSAEDLKVLQDAIKQKGSNMTVEDTFEAFDKINITANELAQAEKMLEEELRAMRAGQNGKLASTIANAGVNVGVNAKITPEMIEETITALKIYKERKKDKKSVPLPYESSELRKAIQAGDSNTLEKSKDANKSASNSIITSNICKK